LGSGDPESSEKVPHKDDVLRSPSSTINISEKAGMFLEVDVGKGGHKFFGNSTRQEAEGLSKSELRAD
jgi:hypothetical protein